MTAEGATATQQIVHWSAVAAGLIEQHGPYLVTEAVCPICHEKNRFTLLESFNSPLRAALIICEHMHRQRFNDDGEREFGFEHWRQQAN